MRGAARRPSSRSGPADHPFAPRGVRLGIRSFPRPRRAGAARSAPPAAPRRGGARDGRAAHRPGGALHSAGVRGEHAHPRAAQPGDAVAREPASLGAARLRRAHARRPRHDPRPRQPRHDRPGSRAPGAVGPGKAAAPEAQGSGLHRRLRAPLGRGSRARGPRHAGEEAERPEHRDEHRDHGRVARPADGVRDRRPRAAELPVPEERARGLRHHRHDRHPDRRGRSAARGHQRGLLAGRADPRQGAPRRRAVRRRAERRSPAAGRAPAGRRLAARAPDRAADGAARRQAQGDPRARRAPAAPARRAERPPRAAPPDVHRGAPRGDPARRRDLRPARSSLRGSRSSSEKRTISWTRSPCSRPRAAVR